MEKGEEKGEILGLKLRRRNEGFLVAKRGGQRTPILPYWRFQETAAAVAVAADGTVSCGATHNFILPVHHHPSISARKLAASLWELNQYRFPLSNMNNSAAAADNGHLPRLRRLHNHRRRQDKPLSSPSSPDLGSASTLKRHIAASLIQHHRSVERSNRAIAIQPVSPASFCSSSMEVTPYNPAATPSSSLDLKVGYSLKTSTELLKVLNRIWSLEEQHAANMSLVKTLKKELDHAVTKIKELVKEQQLDKNEIDGLRNRIEEDKLARKDKEQDRVNVRQELEDERRLRKRSETLHRKMKSSILNVTKDIENERRSRILLEELCDEFALGIRDYDQEVHSLRHKSDKNRNRDRSILHISESWIDERMQMKLGEQQQRQLTVEKLRPEIETFLQSRKDQKVQNLRRSSLESFPLNAAISAPQAAIDDESIGSDSHCFELNQKLPIRIVKNPEIEEGEGSKSTHVIGDLIRSQQFTPETTKPDWRMRASPVREWKPTLPSRDNEISVSSSKLPPELKENTLKAKLMEARSRGRQMSRIKGSKSKVQL
ncbi:uncharacterized protein At5g41620-like [Impatiens glandulifera]|uniref:uncharacterized protein At5g41620-like n=1 Tax=Impatiens glandulifera TaxID=253017 RepID=UPI001FB19808|nr:uncharacterized protein At5g41620-like [Impatiens glandulifera]